MTKKDQKTRSASPIPKKKDAVTPLPESAAKKDLKNDLARESDASSASSNSSAKATKPPPPPVSFAKVPTNTFSVKSAEELFKKRSITILASAVTGLAQGQGSTISTDCLMLFHEIVDSLGDSPALTKFIKTLMKQHKAITGVRSKVNLNPVTAACLMYCDHKLLPTSTTSNLKLKGKFSGEVTVFINRKKYHDLCLQR